MHGCVKAFGIHRAERGDPRPDPGRLQLRLTEPAWPAAPGPDGPVPASPQMTPRNHVVRLNTASGQRSAVIPRRAVRMCTARAGFV